MMDTPVEERILIALFLCSGTPNEMLEQFRPDWNEKTNLSIGDKCSIINTQWSMFNSGIQVPIFRTS